MIATIASIIVCQIVFHTILKYYPVAKKIWKNYQIPLTAFLENIFNTLYCFVTNAGRIVTGIEMKPINRRKRKAFLLGFYAVGGYWIGNCFEVTSADPVPLVLVAISWEFFCSFITFLLGQNNTEKKTD